MRERKPGLNTLRKKVAACVQAGLTDWEAAEVCACSLTMVHKVRGALGITRRFPDLQTAADIVCEILYTTKPLCEIAAFHKISMSQICGMTAHLKRRKVPFPVRPRGRPKKLVLPYDTPRATM